MSVIPVGSLMELPQLDTVEYVKRMIKSSSHLETLHRHFTKTGLIFYFDRAKAYVYSTGPLTGLSPNIIAIIPSWMMSTAADPFHVAVSLVVHHKGFAIAGSVRVEHNPYRISEFSIHEVKDDGTLAEFTVKADVLASLTTDEVAKSLGSPPIFDREEKPQSAAVLLPGEQSTIAKVFFEEVSQDKYVRSFYPPQGLDALKSQIPLMQKFASVNYLRYRGNSTTVLSATSFCTSTSTSCNICTSCSCSFPSAKEIERE